MKRALLAAAIFTILISSASVTLAAVDRIEIRGQVSSDNFTWNGQNFAGFYYDIDDNITTESLETNITDGKLKEPEGVIYRTVAQKDNFSFLDWGSYSVIGFLGERYFAGYLDASNSSDDLFFQESGNGNALAREQLLKILVDSDAEKTISPGTILVLEEGYELSIPSVDINGRKIYLELSRDGFVVERAVISPSGDNSTAVNATYCYKKDIGNCKDLVVIAIHFRNSFRGQDRDLATIDGIWQLSDRAMPVSENAVYGKMTVQKVDETSITMRNEDYNIILSRNRELSLMPGINIKVANNDKLTYYIFKYITAPGSYQIRGNVASDNFTWTADKFAGFYLDLDDGIMTEELKATVTAGKLRETYGVVYKSTAQKHDFEFDIWGSYNAVGFLGGKYFTGYIEDENIKDKATDTILFNESEDRDVLSQGQLLRILVDDNTERAVERGTAIALEEGYELVIDSVDLGSKKVCVQLFRNGSLVERKAVSPTGNDTITANMTYCYRKDIGNSKKLVTIAAHFKDSFHGPGIDLAVIDGLWQLSDNAVDVSENTRFLNMTVQDITSDTVTLSNEDCDISLGRNRETALLPGISIKTADDDELRYYISRAAIVEE